MNPKFFRNGIVMLVLVVGTAALLFTWLTSSPSTSDTPYSEFLQNVEAGNVVKVVQEDNKLTVTPKGSTITYVVFAPGVPGLPNSDVYGDMVAAADRGNVELAADELGGHRSRSLPRHRCRGSALANRRVGS